MSTSATSAVRSETHDAREQARALLAPALDVLDAVLTAAVDTQARLLGPASLMDPWRGMHLDRADVERLLAEPRIRTLARHDAHDVAAALGAAMERVPRVALIAREAELSPLDLALLLLALAPDLDLRYERIFAYLQDDIARKRPATDLLANVLACSVSERLHIFDRLQPNAPLLRLGVLIREPRAERSPLADAWRVDELWRQWLLGLEALGDIGEYATLVSSRDDLSRAPLESDVRATLEAVVAKHRATRKQPRVALYGSHGTGKFETAKALARSAKCRLLVVDLREIAAVSSLRALLRRVQLAGLLYDALPYYHGLQRLEQREPQLLRAFADALASCQGGFILASVQALPVTHSTALEVVPVPLAFPSSTVRTQIWQQSFATYGRTLELRDARRLAERFSLSAAQIRQAVACAATRAADGEIHEPELLRAIRSQCGGELARMAQRIEPRADFAALILPAEVRDILRELCARVATRESVGRTWAGGSVHARTTGITALFAGPSGTGKTLAAEAVARELGLDLYRIDLASIVSKYIGETEKNLDRVFVAAEHANAVLFFDEADALFGKRSEVKDAHDRYANIEVAYLLQKMEQFDGLAILATNLKQNLDEAFARRLTCTVNFPFPEEQERLKLWQQLWPATAERDADIDLGWFAREFRLSGGNIRNTVMTAAHLAAAEGQTVTRKHLLHATRREFQKLGKNLTVSLPEQIG